MVEYGPRKLLLMSCEYHRILNRVRVPSQRFETAKNHVQLFVYSLMDPVKSEMSFQVLGPQTETGTYSGACVLSDLFGNRQPGAVRAREQ
jgi:hypothetical protein